MPDEQRKNLVRIKSGAGAVDPADAVSIAIGTKAGVVFSGAHGFAQRLDMGFDGLGVHAAKKRIARSTNFVASNAIARKEFWQQSGCGTMHGVRYKAKVSVPHAFPIDQLFESLQIWLLRVAGFNKIPSWGEGGRAVRPHG